MSGSFLNYVAESIDDRRRVGKKRKSDGRKSQELRRCAHPGMGEIL